MNRILAYMIAPVRPKNGRTIKQNVIIAQSWLVFLRELLEDMGVIVICPWLAGMLSGDDDSDSRQRERALVESETSAARCDITIAVGFGYQLSEGMSREAAACPGATADLLELGRKYGAFPSQMSDRDRSWIRGQVALALAAPPRLVPGDVVQIVGGAKDGTTAMVGVFGTVLAEGEDTPDIPDAGGVPLYLHWCDDGLHGRVARHRLVKIGRASLAPAEGGGAGDVVSDTKLRDGFVDGEIVEVSAGGQRVIAPPSKGKN